MKTTKKEKTNMKLTKEERELLWKKTEHRKKKKATEEKNELYQFLVDGEESDGIYEIVFNSLEYNFKNNKLSTELKDKLI